MAWRDWGVNITILMLIVNASFFVLFPTSDSPIMASVQNLNNDLNKFFGKDTGGSITILTTEPGDIDTITNIDESQGLIPAIFSTISNIFGQLFSFTSMMMNIAILIFSVSFLGWININTILFQSYPDVAGIFYIVFVALTVIQFTSLVFVLTELAQRIRGALP